MINQKIYTHDGTFHIDELMAIVFIARFYFKKPVSSLEIIRTRDVKTLDEAKLANDFVIDVGREHDPSAYNFDHHQVDESLKHPDGIPKSACGLIFDWLDKERKIPEMFYDYVKNLSKDVDMCDNGAKAWKDGEFFFTFNRGDDEEEQYRQFRKALVAIEGYVDNHLYAIKRVDIVNKEIEKSIKESIDNNHPELLIFDSKVEEARRVGTEKHSAFWIACGNGLNEWSIKTICSDPDKPFSSRRNMPSEWCGLENEALESLTGIKGMRFCHKAGFAAVFVGERDKLVDVLNCMLKFESF